VRRIRVGDVDVALDEHGAGDPVLLAHPASLSRVVWERTMDALAARFRVIAPDLPGHGDTEGETLDFPAFVDGLCEALGVGAAHWIGSSWGGGIAIRAAAFTKRARKLVLVGTTGVPADELPRPAASKGDGPWQVFRSTYEDATLVTRARFRLYTSLQKRAMPYLARCREWLPADYPRVGLTREMARVEAPTLVVWGAKDRTFPPLAAEIVARHVRGARVSIYERSNHFPFLDEPDRFNREVIDFLAG